MISHKLYSTLFSGGFLVKHFLVLLLILLCSNNSWCKEKYILDTTEPIWWEMEFHDPVEFRFSGVDFSIKLDKIKPGDYEVILSFWEDEVQEKGKRVFDILANNALVHSDVDIYSAVGNFKELTKRITVKVEDDSGIIIHLVSKTELPAYVNKITLKNNGDIVWAKLGGWQFGMGGGRKNRFFVTPANLWHHSKINSKRRLLSEPSGWQGTNVIYNGDFEKDKIINGFPEGWYGPETDRNFGAPVKLEERRFWKQGKGNITVDSQTPHEGKGSLKISDTNGIFGISNGKLAHGITFLDWTRPYEIVLWVKAENATGKFYVRADWTRSVNGPGIYYLGSTIYPLPIGSYGWKKIKIPVKPVNGAAAMAIGICSEDNTGSVWVDDLSMDGFGVLPVEVKVSSGGYHPNGNKELVVWSREEYKNGWFRIINKDTGKNVMEGNLNSLGWKERYGRFIWKADFSEFNQEGEFFAEAGFEKGKETKSFEFPIRKDLYLNLSKMGMEYLHIIRANADVPGWHGADALDDGRLPNMRDRAGVLNRTFSGLTLPNRYIPMLGNVYDAGDCSKKPMAMLGSYGLCQWMSYSPYLEKKYKEKLPDPLATAWWITKMYVNSQRPGGGYYIGLRSKGSRWGGMGDPVCSTDGIPGTGDEKFIIELPNPAMCFAIAHFALNVKPFDKELSEKCAESALKNYRPMMLYWNSDPIEKAEPWEQLMMDTYIGLASIYLHQLYPQRKDIYDETIKRVKNILQHMENETHLEERYIGCSVANFSPLKLVINHGFAVFLMDFIRFNKDHNLVLEIKKSLKVFIENILIPAMETNEFGKAGGMSKENRHDFLSGNYHNCHIQATGQIMARASILYDEPRYLSYAERQIQWALGKNYYDICFIMGLGKKTVSTWQRINGVPGCEDGLIPGGAGGKGYFYGNGTEKGYPWGFPIFSGVYCPPPDGYTTGGQECFQIFGEYVLIDSIEVNNAMNYFINKNK